MYFQVIQNLLVDKNITSRENKIFFVLLKYIVCMYNIKILKYQ